MALPDYYTMLEVASHATHEQIKQSYRRLARQYHPDLNGHGGDERIKQLNEAYDVLSDVAKRTAYDIQRLEELRRLLVLQVMLRQREQARREARMTWTQGMAGFVRELKKGMREG